ncbi:MAG: DUF1289 domain-containing protein [Cellvibrio sp.]|nr:DUF1289 domain-containing protein [Cellvibrio sp.]
MLLTSVKTPCVGICSTGIGDNVCRGCKRFSHEVIDWNSYTHEQKMIIAQRLENFLTQIVQIHFHVANEDLLLEQVKHQQILFKPEQNPYCWLFDLLRAGANQIQDLSLFGVIQLASSAHLSLADIRDHIDKDYYALSCAYYDRYIIPEFFKHD